MAFSHVSEFVCVSTNMSVRAVKEKWLELSALKLEDVYHSPWRALGIYPMFKGSAMDRPCTHVLLTSTVRIK